MSTWTLSTIREYARKRSGFGVNQISDGAVDDIINRVYRSMLPLESPSLPIEGFSTIDTVSSVGKYDISDDILKVSNPFTLDDGDGNQVSNLDFYLDPVVFFERFPADDSVDDGVPEAVLLYGNSNGTGTDNQNQLYVRPIPDGAYTIEFATEIRPSLLTSDTDTPVDDDMGYYIGVRTALDILDTEAGGVSDRKSDLENDLKTHEANLNIKKIKQMTGTRSKPRF